MLLSQSQTLVSSSSTTHTLTSSHPHISLDPSSSQDTVEVERLLAEASQPEQTPSDIAKLELERESLRSKVTELEEQLAAVNEGAWSVTRKKVAEEEEAVLMSEGFSLIQKQSLVCDRERENELLEKIEVLQTQLGNLSAEKDDLVNKIGFISSEREREQREAAEQLRTEKEECDRELKEGELLRETLTKSVRVLEEREASLQKELELLREREREWEREKAKLVASEAKLAESAEKEKERAEEKFERCCSDLDNQLQAAENKILELKSTLDEQATQLTSVEKERERLLGECRELQDCLEKKSATESSGHTPQSMQWKAELEEKTEELSYHSGKIQQLSKLNEELTTENRKLQEKYHSLEEESMRWRTLSGNFPERHLSHGSTSEAPSERVLSDVSNASSSERWLKSAQFCQTEITQLKLENEKLRSEKEKLNSSLREKELVLKTEMTTLQSKNAQLVTHSQKEKMRADKLAADSTELRERLSDIESRFTRSEAEKEQMNAECKDLKKLLKTAEARLGELETERARLKVERDREVEELRERLREVEGRKERVSECLECKSHLKRLSELEKSLTDSGEELKRSEYRHQQAQKAYAGIKEQLKLVALEEERKRELGPGVAVKASMERVSEREQRRESKTEKAERESAAKGSNDDEDGWVFEGEGERAGGTKEEVKRLRTELAVERKNRSVVAEELQKVARERDRFAAKFMETERDLRRHRQQERERMINSGVMTSSSCFSSTGGGGVGREGVSGGGEGVRGGGRQQSIVKKISVNISK